MSDRQHRRRRASERPQEWVTISAFAQKHGTDRRTVYKWLAGGLLESYTIGAVTRVRDLPPSPAADQANVRRRL